MSSFFDYMILGGFTEVRGTSGRDVLYGSFTDEFGRIDDDVLLYGLAGDDTLDGLGGNDWLIPGIGSDTVDGGFDRDWLIHDDSAGPVTVDLTAGYALEASGDRDEVLDIEDVSATTGSDTILGDGLYNHFFGLDGDDVLRGGGGDDTLEGHVGSDTLDGGSADDVLEGGPDTDTASYASATSGVEVSLLLASEQDTIGAGHDRLVSIENLTGSAYQDVLTGDGGANVLDGGAASDTLDGQGGRDTASYERTNGPVTVDLANRTTSGTSGTDTLLSIENVVGSGYDDTLIGDSGANLLDGRYGSDTASWLAASGAVTVNLATGLSSGAGGADTLRSIEHAIGSDGHADTLLGNAYSNRLEGRGGNDWLEGAAGGDTLDGGVGEDRASWAGSVAAVTVDLLAGTATGAQDQDTLISIERVTGSRYDDTLSGSNRADLLDGRGGNDTLDGRGGDDTLVGGVGIDTVAYLQPGGAVTVDLAAGTGKVGTGQGAGSTSCNSSRTSSAVRSSVTRSRVTAGPMCSRARAATTFCAAAAATTFWTAARASTAFSTTTPPARCESTSTSAQRAGPPGATICSGSRT